jgi:hypothetical protein
MAAGSADDIADLVAEMRKSASWLLEWADRIAAENSAV